MSIFAAPLLVGLSALPLSAWTSTGNVLVAVTELVAAGCLFVATVVLDDVRGHRDGSDAANYGQPHDFRDPLRKPLLTGLVTAEQAKACAYTAWVVGAVLWCGVLWSVAWRPAPALVLLAVLVGCAPQYSWGLCLSYRGMGEALLVYFSVALTLAAAWIGGPHADARMSAESLLAQAFLVGLWHVTLSSYANSADIAGDRASGRGTAAAVLGPRGNHVYLSALAVADVLLTAAVICAGPAPWWSAAVLAPLAAVRARSAWSFLAIGDARTAHRRFWLLYRLGWPALVLINVSATGLT